MNRPFASEGGDARLRPRLTGRQLALVSAITKSAALKRRLVDATEALPSGTLLRLGETVVRAGPVLGSGLVGVVHAVHDDALGLRVAMKRARARVAFFREALRVERRVAALLEEVGALRCARVVVHQAHMLAKELVTGPTLAELLVAGTLDGARRLALEGVLDVVRHGLERWGVALDVSPKNLAWQGGWVLLDTGPKLRLGEVARLAEARSFDAYFAAYRAKLAGGPSAPSAIATPGAREERLETPARYAFVRDLWRWFPLDPAPAACDFLVDVDDAAPTDEVAVERLPDGTFEASPGLPEAVLEAAQAAWEERSPPRRTLVSLARSSVGRLYGGVRGAPEPRAPALVIAPYDHWKDVLAPEQPHEATDLFCHELLRPEITAPGSFPPGGYRARLSTAPGTFAEIAWTWVAGAPRAYVFVPGFRAGIDAAEPLAGALIERGHTGAFVSTYLGLRTPRGQAIVSAGAWEVPLLAQVVDYATGCLDVERVTLVAASQGAIAAMDVAALHPAVDTLILDSPLATPLELYYRAAAARGQTEEDARARLAAAGLPFERRRYEVPSRAGLRTLSLRPTPDLICEICGHPEGADRVVAYPGPHAATMRHDVRGRGVPEICLEAIDAIVPRRGRPSAVGGGAFEVPKTGG